MLHFSFESADDSYFYILEVISSKKQNQCPKVLGGTDAVVTATGRRFSLNMLSAVSPKGEFRFMLHDGTVTALVFKTFLQRLMVGAMNSVFVWWSMATRCTSPPWCGGSTSRARRACSSCSSCRRTRPSSTRTSRSGRMSNDASAASSSNPGRNEAVGSGALRRIQKLPNLVRSFFRHNECLYARMWQFFLKL